MDYIKLLNTIDLFSEKFNLMNLNVSNIEILYVLLKLIEYLKDFEYELIVLTDNNNDKKLVEFNNWKDNTINEFNKLFKV